MSTRTTDRVVLGKILAEGFISTRQYFADLEIYRLNGERILYDSKNDIVFSRYTLQEERK